MTREEREIIEAIKTMGYDRTDYPREKVSAVISMAIEALSKPNYETDTEVRLAVTDRKKEKVILWDAFGEVEYYPHGDMYCPNCGVRLVPENEYLEPAQTHGRLIDADALSKKLCETTIFIKDGEVFQRMINDAPTVQADRPHGEWVEREDWNGDSYYDCSVCGESFVLFDGTPSMNLYHFCPNCGADMRKEAEVVHKPDYSYEAGMARRLIEETLKNKLQELAQCDDYEMAHREADELLCDFITKLGYGEVAQKFDAVPKWYA